MEKLNIVLWSKNMKNPHSPIITSYYTTHQYSLTSNWIISAIGMVRRVLRLDGKPRFLKMTSATLGLGESPGWIQCEMLEKFPDIL